MTIDRRWWLGAGAVWVAVNAAVLVIAPGAVPFDWPSHHGTLTGLRKVVDAQLVLLQVIALGCVVWWMTRRRPDPAIAFKAPEARVSRSETYALIGYAVGAQLVGASVASAFGWHPFGFHLAGTLVGSSMPVSPAEAIGWAGYNGVVYALLPFLWFRRRYTTTQLCLRSSDRRGDLRLILVVLVLEAALQLAALGHSFSDLGPAQLTVALPLTVGLYLVGTVVPTTIFVQALLVPRYARLTGSLGGTLALGGLTYAALHVFEGWSRFGTLRDATLTILFVVLVYAVPGAFKTLLTVRTGNAWVHAWAYHALAPHTLHDTGLVARVFRL
jgi:hypothetical protein